jgi:CRP-like cAMP-binding protein
MSPAGAAAIERLVRKLNAAVRLTEEEKRSILSLPVAVRDLRPEQDIVREGDRPTQCCVIVDGLACRYRMVAEGKRQILMRKLNAKNRTEVALRVHENLEDISA